MFIRVEIKKLKSRTKKEILGSRATYEMILEKWKMFTKGREMFTSENWYHQNPIFRMLQTMIIFLLR